jgi:hypothetical protein
MMGRIKKMPNDVRGLFIDLVCIYWNKECNLSLLDAELEVGEEVIKSLVKYNIIKVHKDNIIIEFLDIQKNEIDETSSDRSKSGTIGNLKRWHRDLYDKYMKGEISLEDAVKSVATQSQPDSNPIAEQSQIIAEKKREDKKREDKKREDNTIPTYEEFKAYALEKKPKINLEHLRNKYDAWLEAGWMTLGDKPKKIKVWRSTLNNTLKYIDEVKPLSNSIEMGRFAKT